MSRCIIATSSEGEWGKRRIAKERTALSSHLWPLLYWLTVPPSHSHRKLTCRSLPRETYTALCASSPPPLLLNKCQQRECSGVGCSHPPARKAVGAAAAAERRESAQFTDTCVVPLRGECVQCTLLACVWRFHCELQRRKYNPCVSRCTTARCLGRFPRSLSAATVTVAHPATTHTCGTPLEDLSTGKTSGKPSNYGC